MFQPTSYTLLISMLRRRPAAIARLRGNETHPRLGGEVLFYEVPWGVFVVVDVAGLPTATGECAQKIFGLHIHSGSQCEGQDGSPFAMAGEHYNPQGCPHPYHAGDLPPLFGAGDRAFSAFVTDRFKISEVVGKTVILHAAPDDFTTQPAGNAGARIACGVIRGT